MRDLTLDLNSPSVKVPLVMEYLRDLTAADRHLLAQAPRVTPTTTIKRLRDSHHAVARLDAGGAKAVEIAAITGYTPATVYNLRRDPAYQDLVAHYKKNLDVLYADMQERLTGLSLDFTTELRDRLDDPSKAAEMSPSFLLDAIKVLADRTGHAPVQRSVSTNINFDLSGRLKAARARAQLGSPPEAAHEGEVVSSSRTPLASPSTIEHEAAA